MTLQEIHAEIMQHLPKGSFLVVTSNYKNYPNINEETWGCQAYVDNETPLVNILFVHDTDSPERLITEAIERSKFVKDNQAEEIGILEKRLAYLTGNKAEQDHEGEM